MLTPEQVQEYRAQYGLNTPDPADKATLASERIRALKGESSLPPQEVKGPGMMQGLIQGITRPFLKAATTGIKATQGVGNLIQAGIDRIQGNVEGSRRNLEEAGVAVRPDAVDFGYLGKVQPFQSTKEAIGAGLDAGSTLIGGGGLATVAKNGLRGAVIQGMKAGAGSGAYAGAAGSMGRSIQDNAGIGETITSTITGGLTGGAIGGIIGGALPLPGAAAKALPVVRNAATSVARGTTNVVTGVARRGKSAAVEALEKSNRIAAATPEVSKALRSGLDEGVIDFIQSSKPADIKLYDRMIQAAKDGTQNLRIGTQPKEIVGEALLKPAMGVVKARNAIGRNLGDVVKAMPTAKLDITVERAAVKALLEGAGMRFTPEGAMIATKTAVPEDVAAYRYLWSLVKAGRLTPQEMHGIREATFKSFNLAKARQQAFSSDADNVAEAFRGIFGRTLSQFDPRYHALSIAYARLTKPLKDFVQLLGYKGDLDMLGTKSLRAGEVAQRILGNAADRPQSVIDALLEAAFEATGNNSQNVKDLIRFSDLLENFYGSSQTRSLSGQVGRGNQAAAEELADGLVSGGVRGAGTQIVRGVLGTTKKEQQEALEQLIKALLRPAKTPLPLN